MLAVNILSIPQLGTMDLSRVLEWVFLVLPNFCLGQGLNDFYTNYQVLQVCDTPQVKFVCSLHLKEHPFPCCKGTTHLLLVNILFMAIRMVYFSMINLLWRFMSKMSTTFRSVSYGPCSRTGVTCVASDFGGII